MFLSRMGGDVMDNEKLMTGAVLGVLLVATGLKKLISGKMPKNSYAKYTEESLNRFARVAGIGDIVLGVVAVVLFFSWGGLLPDMLFLPMLVVMVVVCVIYVVVDKVMLKKINA